MRARKPCWPHLIQQASEECLMLSELGWKVLQILFRRFRDHGGKNGFVQAQVVRQKSRQHGRSADSRRAARPPDMQPVLRGSLPGIVISLALGREGGAGQSPLEERWFCRRAFAAHQDTPVKEFEPCQSSIRRPSTRPNSRVLWVTKAILWARAMEAIIKSFGPIGVPLEDSSARILP